MLKGIDPLLGPDLLHALAAMGHRDEIAIVATGERRFYGNILVTKGIVPP